jgi:hypothetical protein
VIEQHVPEVRDCQDLGRVRGVKAKPLRGRFASFDASATAKEVAATSRTGQDGARPGQRLPSTIFASKGSGEEA